MRALGVSTLQSGKSCVLVSWVNHWALSPIPKCLFANLHEHTWFLPVCCFAVYSVSVFTGVTALLWVAIFFETRFNTSVLSQWCLRCICFTLMCWVEFIHINHVFPLESLVFYSLSGEQTLTFPFGPFFGLAEHCSHSETLISYKILMYQLLHLQGKIYVWCLKYLQRETLN